MLTHVEFRSGAFPAYESKEEQINPGRFGKRLAEYLVDALEAAGESVGEPIAEDWGWVVPLDSVEFRLWIGVGNYEEYPDGFLCFIEPSKEYVRKLFKKISTKLRVEMIQKKLDDALRSHSDIRSLKWWTADEFNHLAASQIAAPDTPDSTSTSKKAVPLRDRVTATFVGLFVGFWIGSIGRLLRIGRFQSPSCSGGESVLPSLSQCFLRDFHVRHLLRCIHSRFSQLVTAEHVRRQQQSFS